MVVVEVVEVLGEEGGREGVRAVEDDGGGGVVGHGVGEGLVERWGGGVG